MRSWYLDYKIMLTEPPMNPLARSEEAGHGHVRIVRLRALPPYTSVLTLYAQGLLTGCVVDTGDGGRTSPRFDGFGPAKLD